MRIRSKRRAMSVLVFSTQSLRRSASRAFSFAIAELRASSTVGATLRAGQAPLQHAAAWPRPACRPGACSSSPVDSAAETSTPRSTPTTCRYRARDRGRDLSERDMPAAGTIAGDPVRLHSGKDRPDRNRTQPTFGTHTRPNRRFNAHVAIFHRDLPEPLMHTGFAPPRAAVGSGKKVAHRLGEIPQCLLLHRLGTRRQPRAQRGPRQLSALIVVARRTAAARQSAAARRQIPHIPRMATMLGQHRRLLSRRNEPVSRTPDNVTPPPTSHRKEKRRFLPG